MKTILISFITFFSFPIIMQAQQPPAFPAGSEAFFNKAMKAINARHVAWVKSTAKKTNEKNWTETQVKTESSKYAVLGNINGADIEALAFLVLMQAAKSAQEDLKAIMAKVKSINNAKAKQRENINKAQQVSARTAIKYDSLKYFSNKTKAILKGQDPDTVKFRSSGLRKAPAKTDMDALVDQMKNDLDSMSEMGETESLRLQGATDRMSNMMSTIANMLKKISDTQDAIIANMK